jgi:hypothetical protein
MGLAAGTDSSDINQTSHKSFRVFFRAILLSQRTFISIHVYLNVDDTRGNITQSCDGTWALRIDQRVTQRLQVSDMGRADDLFKE